MRWRLNRCGNNCAGSHIAMRESTPRLDWVVHPNYPRITSQVSSSDNVSTEWTSPPLKVGWWRFCLVTAVDYEDFWTSAEITNPQLQESITQPIHSPSSKLYLKRDGDIVRTLQASWHDALRSTQTSLGFGGHYVFAYVETTGMVLNVQYDSTADTTNRNLNNQFQQRGNWEISGALYQQYGNPFNVFHVVGDLLSGCSLNRPMFGAGFYFPESYGYPWRTPSGINDTLAGYPYYP